MGQDTNKQQTTGVNSTLQGLSRRRFVLVGLAAAQLTLLALLWRAGIVTPDFFPLYLGAELVRLGQSPYGPDATALLMERWTAPEPFPRAGIAYPLPVLALVVPLTLLPFPLAAGLWVLIGASVAALVSRLPDVDLLLPMLFWPLFWSAAIGQATLIWFGLSVLLILAMRDRRVWLVGGCIALLPLKPQSGLLFALLGCWWAWQEDRKAFIWAAGVGGVVAALAFALQPGWLWPWLGQLAVYSAAVRPISLFPWAIVLLLACWRLPWAAKIAIPQVFLFPLVRQEYGIDPYTMLPLLLVWCGIGGRAALVGAGLSWLWPLFLVAGWGTIATELTLLAPLAMLGSWHSWGYLLKPRAVKV
jgi:hypothetical protein